MKDKTKLGSPDMDYINLQQDEEVKYWIEKFDITKVKLRAAVNAAGTSAKAVEAYLKNK